MHEEEHMKNRVRAWPKAGVGMAAAVALAATGGGVAWAATSHPTPNSAPRAALMAPGRGPLGRRPRHFALTGRIETISSSSITLAGPLGATTTVSTTSSTKYRAAGKAISASALQSGERVGIRLEKSESGTTKVAKTVVVLYSAIVGRIEAVGSTSTPTLSVAEPSGIWVQVDTSAATVVREQKSTVSLSSLSAGERVRVMGMAGSDHSVFDAEVIAILPQVVGGKVLSVSGSTIDIQADGGYDETIVTSSSTTFLEGPRHVSLSSVTEGEHIRAAGSEAGTATLDASRVRIAPPRPARPMGMGGNPPAPPVAPPASSGAAS